MAVTYGSALAPSQKTINFDDLFTTSLANSRRTLIDNISASNAFWMKITGRGDGYKSADGGTNIEEPLLYALGSPDTYDGYDELDTAPMDGITKAIYDWRQVSVPITISRKEERQNAQRIIDMLEAKIMQAEMGIKEFIPKMMFQGNGAAALETPRVSAVNGSSGIEPIAKIVQNDPTTSTVVGNINQSTSSWWQNRQKTADATTGTAFLVQLDNLFNTCSLGPGGSPDLLVCDQETFEIFKQVLWNKVRMDPATNMSFPFENFTFRGATVVFDEFVPDTATPALDTTTLGTMFMLNTKFFNIRYDSQSNFINTPFQKPVNQDARVSHILWMGNVTCNNRRKQGVAHNIARAASFTSYA